MVEGRINWRKGRIKVDEGRINWRKGRIKVVEGLKGKMVSDNKE
ncbi:hypothetical protein [Peribacillus butanolivorans]|nr:hypothetical protein [Peribacillus butanolivorans]